jgi:cell division protein FtsI (penicillin-binding protein 3)
VSAHFTPTHHRVRPLPVARRGSSASPARRLKLVRAGFVLVFVALGVRLFFLQVVDHPYFNALSVGQVRVDLTTTALRAGIYDRNAQILAVSRPTSVVIADDMQISHPATEAAAMAPLVHVPVAKLTRLLSKKHDGYVVITNDLNLAAGHQVSSLVFPGIVVQSSSVRTYPSGPIATSVLGGTNAQGAGSAGLEYKYQSLLAGRTGVTRAFVSSSGVNLPSAASSVITRAKPGVGLELTLDTSLQFVAERALARELAATGAVDGTAVVMDVKTGEILADASLVNTRTHAGVLGPVPAWGKSVGVPGIQQTINNLAFSQAYEPGSVFKLVTFSAALQQGLITPRSVFTVPYAVNVGGRYFHDAEVHGLEHLTATQILALSSNIGTFEVASRVGEAGLLAQVERLGFGQQTPVDFPGETSGLLVSAANWHTSDRVALPIGQVDAVPPIQILDAYNTIANGGVYVAPKLVRGYVNANGTVSATPPSVQRRALSPAVDATMVAMLEQVVLAGTGTSAIIPGYSVAGKTGTASMFVPGRAQLLSGAYNATFVGFAPANAPVLSMIVVVERPQTMIFGGEVAAPVFQQVMSYALHHYGIPSNGTVVKPLTGKASISSDVT